MNDKITLKRSLTLPLLVLYGVGTILGVGIYVLLGKIAGEAGMYAYLSFIISAAIAGFTGLSYGELAARIPKSAGEVNFVQEAFHKRFISMIVGWMIVLSAIVSTSTIVNGYVGYVHVFSPIPSWIIIIFITCLLGGIAIWGITQSAVAIATITIIEILGLIFVIAIAGSHLSELPERYHEFIPDGSPGAWTGIFMGAFLAFFAFIGFEDLVNVAEEAKDPRRDIPKAIIYSLVISTFLYIIIAVIGSLGLSPEQLNESKAPLADMLAQKGKNYPIVISAIGLVAIINGVLVQIVMGSRVMYGMADSGLAPAILGRIHPRTRTPVISTCLIIVVILILALSFPLESLAKSTNFILLSVFTLVNISLIFLKIRQPDKDINHYKVHIAIPFIGAILTSGLLIFQIIILAT
ncbi:MAG: amino acid permease [Bacteroidetes bacterium]|nr:amino acid permease [Bacteroidota bacterium]